MREVTSLRMRKTSEFTKFDFPTKKKSPHCLNETFDFNVHNVIDNENRGCGCCFFCTKIR